MFATTTRLANTPIHVLGIMMPATFAMAPPLHLHEKPQGKHAHQELISTIWTKRVIPELSIVMLAPCRSGWIRASQLNLYTGIAQTNLAFRDQRIALMSAPMMIRRSLRMLATAMAQLTMPLEFVVATALHLQMVLIAIYSMIPLMEQPNVLEVIPKMRLMFVGGIVTSMKTMIFFATT